MKTKVGVIVGRFQLHELHNGHRQLIDTIIASSDHTVIFLGCNSTGIPNEKYPLDYYLRMGMIKKMFPGVTVMPVLDNESNAKWVAALDDVLSTMYPTCDVKLYGGRDSFIDVYGEHSSNYPTEVLNFGNAEENATEVRDRLGKHPEEPTSDFRAGIIHARMNMVPVIYPTVDVCMYKRDGDKVLVLMGKKQGETKWRFPGGFVDFKDSSKEDAARRELHEETGLTVEGGLEYVGSFTVNDWRYRGIPNAKIMTTLYATEYTWGEPKAADDLAEVAMMSMNELDGNVVASHVPLYTAVKEYLTNNKGERK